MKKYIKIVLIISILFILFRFFFLFIYRGRIVNYKIINKENTYEVHEEYIRNKKGITNHYYLEIEFAGETFNFRIADIFDRKSYIVDTIYSFKNEQYSCVLPIFLDDSIQTDILCKKDKTIYPYRKLKNESLSLDKFATSMEENGYSVNISNNSELSKYGIDVLENNFVASHKVVIPSYNGIYIIDKKTKNIISSVELFENDVYVQSIQGVVSDYYIVADYDSSYSFHKFKLVNLNTRKVSTITSDSAISMDSYVQGVVDNCIYIIDRSNKKQYKIDVSNHTISLVGNLKKGILYYNGSEFETKSIYDAINTTLLFGMPSYEFSKYDYVYLNDNVYYSYLKVKNGYDVYISYEENPSLYTYAFFTSSIETVQYMDDYVYYIEDDYIYYYHLKTGVIKLLTYKELSYNSSLNFWIYKK